MHVGKSKLAAKHLSQNFSDIFLWKVIWRVLYKQIIMLLPLFLLKLSKRSKLSLFYVQCFAIKSAKLLFLSVHRRSVGLVQLYTNRNESTFVVLVLYRKKSITFMCEWKKNLAFETVCRVLTYFLQRDVFADDVRCLWLSISSAYKITVHNWIQASFNPEHKLCHERMFLTY